MKWYLEVLKKYVVFDGRARRQEFWMFVLFNFIFGVVAGILDNVLGLNFKSSYSSSYSAYASTGYISMIYSLAVLLPTLAVAVRRLHDIGKSGWMILVGLIPFVGWIWLLVLYVTEGQQGPNQYGPDPKGGAPVPPMPVQ
jgi:uncharacterized membrane protein YhaH (DUF805 family)